ncbi:uncharacterized protein Pyn_20836 [Prunus yedoensis var. nudiflora]|uniref:Uncharacterized protein n=1 Tax=Prunus yedoensis var. nudiflora TaxID=2094558 RepID=A0A314ZIY9_PRUYE|nr:uncharacterized protein Pyn_20836 [Prunus yedoensis var. nudiflora]
MKKISQAWLKTHAGYRPPSKCLLFDSKFDLYLKHTDGPFLDVEFYGSNILSYRKELSAIGVIVDVEQGYPLISGQLDVHDELSTFIHIYNYLREFKWKPDTEAARKIWIPKGSQNGEWVSADDESVIYDKEGLFSLQLTVLEKYFEQKLLVFFSSAFRVKSHPSVDDYLKLWQVWESSESRLSHDQCCKFWVYVTKHWNLKKEKSLADALLKLFEQASHHPLFVWYPQPSLPALPRTALLEMYRKIGVRTISESVQKLEVSPENGIEQVVPRDNFIGKGLLRLILGFLADTTLKMEAERRHEAVQGLLNLTVAERTEPITISYKLSLSSGEILNVRASRKMRLDKEKSNFFTQKMDRSGGLKSVIELATYFAEVISGGVLWENTDYIPALSGLIKLAFVLEFNEEAIDFLMKSKNLQIFMEDEEFLKSAYPSD